MSTTENGHYLRKWYAFRIHAFVGFTFPRVMIGQDWVSTFPKQNQNKKKTKQTKIAKTITVCYKVKPYMYVQ